MKVNMRNPKTIRILLVQPPSEDRKTLLRLLNRVGFLTEVSWPPSPQVFDFADVVFAAFRAIVEENIRFPWNAENPSAALVALLDFESPAIIHEAVRLNAHAVIGMPIRSFGVVANVFIAQKNFFKQKQLSDEVRRLNARGEAEKLFSKAKDILMRANGISEDEAHALLRTQAMNKRLSMQEIARSIINAEGIISDFFKKPDC